MRLGDSPPRRIAVQVIDPPARIRRRLAAVEQRIDKHLKSIERLRRQQQLLEASLGKDEDPDRPPSFLKGKP